ncbi:MAG TPA: ornithine carbamoyltransferase [Anaerolineae bacterium]|nr:ornithine carbamoyltransferase [Anaerolineae bacterium]HOQ98776.1 ornithine carbamoyltransferase [Anaerolineae bacterium]HPL28744.1 ornithine carbamoyltransferase [Anaerolineae bacterium]
MKKDFISLADLAPAEIQGLLDEAVALKAEWQRGGNKPLLGGKALGMIFQKPSLRTRVSFEMGMHHLGGSAICLSPDEIGLGKRESVADVARVLSRYVDGIMARVFAHSLILELARHSAVPVINGLSDYNHPCQGVADLLTIYEKLGSLKGVTLAYVGDANNVLTSLLFGGSKLGMRVVAATPPDYAPSPEVLEPARRFAAESGGAVEVTADPHAAVRGADVIYTDTWTSMGQEAEREQRLQVFPPYQVNARLVSEAKPEAIVMHCLPAHRGEEITDEVMDGPHSAVFDQAENRMHAQKAVLASLMR